jgi:hypothetical protein
VGARRGERSFRFVSRGSPCVSVDECADWVDQAERMRIYAVQMHDETLVHMAMRIKGRAIARWGELARELEPEPPGRPKEIPASADRDLAPREKARLEAGVSKNQMTRAMQVGAVPAAEREAMLERPGKPATVTELAERGRKASTAHLKGHSPEDFGRGLLRSW